MSIAAWQFPATYLQSQAGDGCTVAKHLALCIHIKRINHRALCWHISRDLRVVKVVKLGCADAGGWQLHMRVVEW